ncbi:MAG: hypothetical protein ACPLXA_12810 [Moorellaceae bacterium]
MFTILLAILCKKIKPRPAGQGFLPQNGLSMFSYYTFGTEITLGFIPIIWLCTLSIVG